MLDLPTAQAFLDELGSPPFVFQTFTDSKEARKKFKRDPLARVMVGTLETCGKKLAHLSSQGAGVFVQVSEGEARGNKAVTGIRSLFLDLDEPDTLAQSMQSLGQHMPAPTCIVKSSPGKCHVYWRVADCPVDKFLVIQRSLAVTFGGDTGIISLDRVMRLPGFPHQKYDPVQTHFSTIAKAPYSTLDLIRAASQAPIMALPKAERATPGVVAPAAVPNDTFGLGIAPAYETPTSLPPGKRTQQLVRHAGYLISQGYSEEYARDELRRMNIELCPEGAEPITEDQLELEVLGAVTRFAESRQAESPHVEAPPPPPLAAPPVPVLVPPPPATIEAVPDTNMEVHTLDAWVDRFLFIEAGSKIADRTRTGEHAVYQFQEFQRKYANVFIGPQSKLVNRWFSSPTRQDVRDTVFIPSAQKIIAHQGVKLWNRYSPSGVVAAELCEEAVLAPFFRHIEFLFPAKGDRELFIDWMAMTVTKPELRIPWTPLLISPPGAGKGLIYAVLSKLMGEHNCNMIIPERLENQFNGFIANSTLVCIDEMKFSAKYGISDKLKNLISETKMEVNVKGEQEKNTQVYANVIIFSNHINATYVEDKDRRFWVHRIDLIPDTAHFEELWSWLDEADTIPHLLKWFQERNLKGFKYASHPPMTEAKQEMIDAGKGQIELLLEDAIEFREGPFAADIVSYCTVESFIMDALGESSVGRKDAVLRQVWSRASKTLPRDTTRVTLKIGKHKQVRIRCIRNLSHWTKATKESLSYEATRAAQMLMTPNDIDPPELKGVK